MSSIFEEKMKTGGVRADANPSLFQVFVMRPSSPRRLTWDILSTIVVLYDLLTLPLEAFNPAFTVVRLAIDWFTTIFWFLDMFASCLTGFYFENVLEMRVAKIARHYLRSWFLIDIATLSTDLVILVLSLRAGIDTVGVLRMSKTARLVRILRFVRLIRLQKLREVMNHVFDRTSLSEHARILLHIAGLLFCVLLSNHYLACGWYLIAERNWFGAAHTWLTEQKVRGDHIYWYVTAMHWSLTQFTPASMEVVPTNAFERLYCISVLLCGLIALSSFISGITGLVANLRKLRQDAAQQELALRTYLSDNGISAELGLSILKYLSQHAIRNKKRMQEKDLPVLQFLPESVLFKLHGELYIPLITNLPFFQFYSKNCPRGVLEICHRGVRVRSLSSGEIVFRENELAKTLYFTLNGSLDYRHKYDMVKQSVHSGQCIVEQALWMHWPHCGRLIGSHGSEVVELSGDQFREIVTSEYHRCGHDTLTHYAHVFSEHVLGMEDWTDLLDIGELELLLAQMRETHQSKNRRPSTRRTLAIDVVAPGAGLGLVSSLKGFAGQLCHWGRRALKLPLGVDI